MDRNSQIGFSFSWRKWLLGPLWEKINHLENMAMATQQQIDALIAGIAGLKTTILKQNDDIAAELAAIAGALQGSGVSSPAVDQAIKDLTDLQASATANNKQIEDETASLAIPPVTPPVVTPAPATSTGFPAGGGGFPATDNGHINPALVGAGLPKA
jgi:hypothetical protein